MINVKTPANTTLTNPADREKSKLCDSFPAFFSECIFKFGSPFWDETKS